MNCPRCKGAMLNDYDSGETVCRRCGFVIALIEYKRTAKYSGRITGTKSDKKEKNRAKKIAYQDRQSRCIYELRKLNSKLFGTEALLECAVRLQEKS